MPEATQPYSPEGKNLQSFSGRLGGWMRETNFERKLAVALLVTGMICGITTYFAFTDFWSTHASARVISWLLLSDLFIVMALGTIIARRLVLLWIGRHKGLAGARLHARLVLIFSLVAVTPTIIVSFFSTAFLNYGLDAWFSTRIRTAVESSLNVAQAYLTEQQQRIGNDTLALAGEIQRIGIFDLTDPRNFNDFLDQQLQLRGLSEAVIINDQRRILARGGFSLLMEVGIDVPDEAFLRARNGETVILPTQTGDRVRALLLLDGQSNLYLYTGRLIDARVIANVRANEDAVHLYHALEENRSRLQITVALIFAILALLLLMAAIWFAITSATQLVRPISRLATTAEKIGSGDLSARVKIGVHDDELTALSRTFNVMALQLQTQQQALVAANRQLDDRRRFTELVLSGVSAGVIGLTEDGRIYLPNRSASDLLGINLDEHIGEPLEDIVPYMEKIMEQAATLSSGSAEGQVSIVRNGENRMLHVRIASESGDQGIVQFVVTFDDVSDLLSAQRKAAWSDIARRIAHEIKNPLTPIQLSAERLKRKYLKQIIDDPETFSVCTDTIIRQVGDIGRMVDEFSAFARMPAPVLRVEDPCAIVRQAVFLQQNAHRDILYQLDFPEKNVIIMCDGAQLNRAITNLLQNAADSIEARLGESGEGRAEQPLPPGIISVAVKMQPTALVIIVEDNGRGLPQQDRERLTEPYVTTRAKGTGLGLAIVKKIMEDHGGKLTLSDRAQGGAIVSLSFPSESLGKGDASYASTERPVLNQNF